jgi:RNA polymerase sigma factor (sigma-70 family)
MAGSRKSIKTKRHGKVQINGTIPYGTLANASPELRIAYYYYGYKNDDQMPPLPCPPPNLDEPYICPEEELLKKEMAQLIGDILDGLTPMEAKTLRLRHGMSSNYEMTLEEIGVAFRLTRERIRQIEAKAIRKLKNPYRYQLLIDLFEPI